MPSSVSSTNLCVNTGNGNQVGGCSSLRSLKTNITDLRAGIETLQQFRPVEYNWIDDGHPELGFIAEEVEIIGQRYATYDSNGDLMGVRYEQLTALLTNVVVAQQKQIEDLQAAVCITNPESEFC